MADQLEDLAASFRRHLRAEGKSERTATIYLQAVRMFSAWLVDHGRPTTADELTRGAIREWLASLAEVGRAPGTIRTRWKGLHRFSGWLIEEEDLDRHPMEGIAVPAVPDTSPCRFCPTTSSLRSCGRARGAASSSGATRRSSGS